jgi:kynurenine formamidase
LIDYASWAEKKGIKYSTFSTHQVRMSDMLEIAKECNITFQKGDVLFVRVGVTKEWDTVMTDEQKKQYSDNPSPEHAGVEATTDMLRWLWDSGFAAIASDTISWEVRLRSRRIDARKAVGLKKCDRSTRPSLMCSCMSMYSQDGECQSVSPAFDLLGETV